MFGRSLFALRVNSLQDARLQGEHRGGLHSANRLFVYYVTSDPNDPHLGEEGVIYVDSSKRGMEWSCSALDDTHNTYCVAGRNRHEDDHLLARWSFCPCRSC